MADSRHVPELVMIVTVERALFHCGKCISRSKLWNNVGEQASDLAPENVSAMDRVLDL